MTAEKTADEEHSAEEIGHNALVNLAIRADDAGMKETAQELIEHAVGTTSSGQEKTTDQT